MPSEDRRLTFDYEEVYKAIYSLSTQKQLRKPPAGKLSNIYEDESKPGVLVFQLLTPQDPDHSSVEVEYNRDFMAAALMLFCRGLGIPLPKTANKSVMVRDGNIMLRVQI